MSGTKAGAAKAAETNREKYGDDFYARIGKLGGAKGAGMGYTGGFAAGEAGRARARLYGVIGGRKSRRSPMTPTARKAARLKREQRERTLA